MRTASISVINGSADLRTTEVGGFRVTDVVFPPRLALASHYHERACFAVILGGSVEKAFDRSTHTLTTFGAVTMPPHERHRDRFERAGAHILVVEPDPVREESLRACAELFRSVHLFRDVVLAGIACRLRDELRHPDALSPLAIDGLVLELLATAARCDARGESGTPPAWLEKAREVLHARFAAPPRVAEVAAVAGVHPAHLARRFRSSFGVPMGEYVRRLRLDWAATRLTKDEAPLCDIALEAGFADQSHFTRAFKRRTGLTPGSFRRAFQRRGSSQGMT